MIFSCGDDDDDDSDPLEGVEYEMLISSRSNNSVVRFNGETGELIGDFVTPGSGGLGRTQEVLIGMDGQLIVSGRSNNAIKRYDIETGEFLGDFTSGFTLDEPVKMSFGPDNDLYVSQWGQSSSSVVRFSGTSGQFVEEVTPDLDRPMGQFFHNDLLHVVSFGTRDVRSYSEGEQVEVVVNSSRLGGPVNLWFEDDSWFVEDWQDGTIKQFSSEGAFQGVFLSGLTNIEGSAIGPDGALYVCDWGRSLVRKHNAETGEFIEVFARGSISNPNSILFRRR